VQPARIRQTVDPVRQAGQGYRFKIVCLDVDHGDATLLVLPTGRVALVDSAKEEWAARRIIPFLDNHAIGEISYFITTHYHEDHVGLRERILHDYLVKQAWDYRTFTTGQEVDLEGVLLTVLNSYADAEDENDRSLSFRLEYNGFSYVHGADLYAEGQERVLARFPELVPAHVYRANHHLHGSVSKDYLTQTDPVMVVVSAQEAVYRRVAYTRDFADAVSELRTRGARLRDVCLTLERGNVVIFANDGEDWGYATYRPEIILAGLYP
jgi:competence protein ComEC